MLEFLDAPRQAVWNLGRGVSDMASGEAPSLADIVPGAGGMLLGTALAGTGVGIPLSILLGSLAGGATQSAIGNEAMTPGQFLEDHLGVDQESTGGMIGSMALGMATDPLSLAIPAVPGRVGGIERAAKGIGDMRYNRQIGKQLGEFPVGQAEARLGEQAGMVKSVEPGTLGYNNFRNPKPLLDDAATRMQAGAFSSPDDLMSIQQKLEDGGMLSRMLDPATRSGNQSLILQQMQQPAIDKALQSMIEPGAVKASFPLGRSIQTRVPEVELGRTMSQGNVPLPPEAVMQALQSRPDVVKQLLAQASIPEAAGGLAAFKTPAAQQKYLSQRLAELLSEQSFGNFKGLMPDTPIPAEYLANIRPMPGV
jgi:hypothetical protein